MDPEKKPEENKVEEVSDKIRSEIKPLRTYQGDIEQAISKNKASSTTIFVAEQKKRGFTPPEAEEQAVYLKTRNKIFVTGGMFLFFLGILSISAVYYVKSQNQVFVEEKTKSLIVFSRETKLSLASSTKEQIKKKIVEEKNSFKMPPNSVLYLNTIDNGGLPTKTEDFLSIITTQIPSQLSRSFGEKYMLGVYSSTTKEPFIIMSVDDFPTSYSGMLKWEKDMSSDLDWLFPIEIASTTTAAFVDEELQNKDLRILKDETGKTLLVYSFIDKTTLVITSNENILSAIVGKYIISKQTK